MATWTLAAIEQKVRKIVGRFGANEFTSEELRTRINQYYQLTFPAELKLEQKKTYYTFYTEANIDTYAAPLTLYTNFLPPATINSLSLVWYQAAGIFNDENPLGYAFSTPWTGDGSATVFTTTISKTPLYPGKLTISDTVENFEDTNTTWTASNVIITGDQGGTATINYDTGAVSVTFNTAPPDGQGIFLNYVSFVPRRPQSILYFNNEFRLWPVPDQAYLVQMQAYQVVTALTTATSTPDLNEWGPAIAFGTARDILADYGEHEEYARVSVLYREQLDYVMRRTHQDLLNVRSRPQF